MSSWSLWVSCHFAGVYKRTRSPSSFINSFPMSVVPFLILLHSLSEMSCKPGLHRMRLHLDQMLSHLLSSNATTICEREFGMIVESTVRRELWALKVMDAWGKPLPSGLLNDNTYWTGNYDECIQPLYQSTNKKFLSQPLSTQHCASIDFSGEGNEQNRCSFSKHPQSAGIAVGDPRTYFWPVSSGLLRSTLGDFLDSKTDQKEQCE